MRIKKILYISWFLVGLVFGIVIFSNTTILHPSSRVVNEIASWRGAGGGVGPELMPTPGAQVTPYPPYWGVVPTFWIVSVVPDASVTLQTHNFPANINFSVLMGPLGTKGVGGYPVGTLYSRTGGTLTASFAIPPQLRGSYIISIRLENFTSDYYSYNWFYNYTPVLPVVDVEWPPKVFHNQPGTIKVIYKYLNNPQWGSNITEVPSIEVTGNMGKVATPHFIGTPGAPLSEALGDPLSVCLTAKLISPTFETDSQLYQPDCIPIMDDEISWKLPFAPKEDYSGDQTIIVKINVNWTTDGINRTFPIYEDSLTVEVVKPWIELGTLTVASILLALLSSLSAWEIYKDFRDRREKKRADRNKQKILLPPGVE